jgi:hypothetical protein
MRAALTSTTLDRTRGPVARGLFLLLVVVIAILPL